MFLFTEKVKKDIGRNVRLIGFSSRAVKYGKSMIEHPMVIKQSQIIVNKYKKDVENTIKYAVRNRERGYVWFSVDSVHIWYGKGYDAAKKEFNCFKQYGIAEVTESYKKEGLVWAMAQLVFSSILLMYTDMKIDEISEPKESIMNGYEIEMRYEIDLGNRFIEI